MSSVNIQMFLGKRQFVKIYDTGLGDILKNHYSLLVCYARKKDIHEIFELRDSKLTAIR